jgi:hypothetical protein
MNHAASTTNWLPGVMVLVAGFVAAALFLLLNRKAGAMNVASGTADDLEARYRGLIAELKELISNKHLMEPAAFATEKSRLEQAAARVLKDRDGVKHESLKAQARAARVQKAQAAAPNSGMLKGFLWGGGAVGFFALLGVLLSQQAKPREEGREMTGMKPPGAGGEAAAPGQDPDAMAVRALFDRLNANPDDLDLLAEASSELLRRQMWDDAEPLVRRATLLDPYAVKSRVHRAVIAAVSDPKAPQPLVELQHLADTYDGAYEARLFAGLLLLQNEQGELALAQFDRFLAEAPDSEAPPSLRMGLAQLRQELRAGKPPGAGP